MENLKKESSQISDFFHHSYIPSDKKIYHRYKKGDSIFLQGTPCLGVYCLGEGLAKLFIAEEDGSEIILSLMGKGKLLNFGAITGESIHVSSAVALEDTECCFIETAEFLTILKTQPLLSLDILQKINAELSLAHDRSIHLIKKSVRSRLARFFVTMSEKYGKKSTTGLQLNLKLSREEIAAFIGSTPETVIRFISEFKNLHLIEEDKSYFVINKEEMMKLI